MNTLFTKTIRPVVALSVVLFVALFGASFVYAQTQLPPLGNTNPPINDSASGQVKSGGLSVGSLIVNGGSVFNNNVTLDGNLSIQTNGSGVELGFQGSGATNINSNTGGTFFIRNQSVGSLRLGTSNTDRLSILSDGRVGIGLSTPTAGLLLEVNGSVGAPLYCDENALNCIDVANVVVSTSPTGSIGFWNEAGGNVYRSTGNVGIGTAAPNSAKLVIETGGENTLGARFLSNGNAFLDITPSNTTGFDTVLSTFNNRDFVIQTGTAGTAGNVVTNVTGGSLLVGTNDLSPGLKLDVAGKVGATEYCDANGLNCTTPAAIVAGAAGDNLGNHTATTQVRGTFGTAALPSYAFGTDTNTGIYRFGTDDIGFAGGGVPLLSLTGSRLASTHPLRGPNATAALPTFAFTSDADTGIYRTASNQLGISTGGGLRATFNSTGIVLPTTLRVTAAAAPTATTHLTNKAYVDAQLAVAGDNLGNHLATATLNLNGNRLLNAASPTFTGGIDQVQSGTYDIWIQGEGIGGAANRNLALLGLRSADLLYLNYNGEYSGGVHIGTNATGIDLENNGDARFSGRITAALAPTIGGHLANKTYVDAQVASASGGDNLGTHIATADIRAINGTAASPSFTFNSDQDTGIYRTTTNQLGISTGGGLRATFNSTGLNLPGNAVITGGGTGIPLVVDGGGDASLVATSGYLLINGANTTNIVIDDNEIIARNNGAAATLHLNATGGAVNLSGGTIVASAGRISASAAPTSGSHLANKTYVDAQVASASGGGDNLGTHIATADIRAINGTTASPSFTFNSDQDTGIYRSAANQISISTGGSVRASINSVGLIVPGRLRIGAGSSALPSVTFTNDTDSGLYRIAANQVGIVTGGVLRARINSSGISAAAFLYTSDKRLKTNLISFSERAEDILNLNTYGFDWKSGAKEGESDFGLIAQEVERYFPEAVKEKGDGYKAVDYVRLIAPLLEVTKQQQIEINELKATVKALQNK